MKTLINKTDLIKALSICLNVVEKKATMPILTNILLSANSNKLSLSATDLEITAVINVAAKTVNQGSTTINAKIFNDIVRELPDGEISLELTSGQRLEINAGRSNLKINGVSADEYPALPGIGINVTNSISATQLLDMINKTIYSTSGDETCFNLTGVYFCSVKEGNSEQLRLVATDGHRLSIITRPANGINIAKGVIVPKKGLSEIRRFLSELQDAEVGIGLKDGFLILDTQEAKFSMRLIDGEFPDYRQVVPKGSEAKAEVMSANLSQALRRVALLVTDKMKCVRLNFNKNEIKISSSSPELGEASEIIEAGYSGSNIDIGFNAQYLMDVAASVGENQQLVFELNGALGPAKVYAAADPSYYGIVMPMRLS